MFRCGTGRNSCYYYSTSLRGGVVRRSRQQQRRLYYHYRYYYYCQSSSLSCWIIIIAAAFITILGVVPLPRGVYGQPTPTTQIGTTRTTTDSTLSNNTTNITTTTTNTDTISRTSNIPCYVCYGDPLGKVTNPLTLVLLRPDYTTCNQIVLDGLAGLINITTCLEQFVSNTYFQSICGCTIRISNQTATDDSNNNNNNNTTTTATSSSSTTNSQTPPPLDGVNGGGGGFGVGPPLSDGGFGGGSPPIFGSNNNGGGGQQQQQPPPGGIIPPDGGGSTIYNNNSTPPGGGMGPPPLNGLLPTEIPFTNNNSNSANNNSTNNNGTVGILPPPPINSESGTVCFVCGGGPSDTMIYPSNFVQLGGGIQLQCYDTLVKGFEGSLPGSTCFALQNDNTFYKTCGCFVQQSTNTNSSNTTGTIEPPAFDNVPLRDGSGMQFTCYVCNNNPNSTLTNPTTMVDIATTTSGITTFDGTSSRSDRYQLSCYDWYNGGLNGTLFPVQTCLYYQYDSHAQQVCGCTYPNDDDPTVVSTNGTAITTSSNNTTPSIPQTSSPSSSTRTTTSETDSAAASPSITCAAIMIISKILVSSITTVYMLMVL